MLAAELRAGDAIVLDSQVKVVRSAGVKTDKVITHFYNGEMRTFPRDAVITDTADYNVA
jgi:hypothetical protein